MPRELRGGLDQQGFHDLLGVLTDPTPATQVRLVLKVYRDRGYAFEYAWAQAMRMVPRSLPDHEEWKTHFHEHKAVWKRSYNAPQRHETPAAA